MTRFAIVLVTLFAFALAACGSPDAPVADAPVDAVADAPAAAEVEEEAPEPTESEPTESEPTEVPPTALNEQLDQDADITDDLTAGGEPWTEYVISAIQTEPNRVEVETSIVDPRGDDGSSEAQQAIAVCQGGVAWLQAQGVIDPKVNVAEADGTTFVTYGVPSLSEGACTEY